MNFCISCCFFFWKFKDARIWQDLTNLLRLFDIPIHKTTATVMCRTEFEVLNIIKTLENFLAIMIELQFMNPEGLLVKKESNLAVKSSVCNHVGEYPVLGT